MTTRTYEPAQSRATAREIQQELAFIRAMTGKNGKNKRRKLLTVEDWIGFAFLVSIGIILGAAAAICFAL